MRENISDEPPTTQTLEVPNFTNGALLLENTAKEL